MSATLAIIGLFISLAWTQKCFLDRLLEADIQRFTRPQPDSDQG